jgi:competence protein ComEC
VIKEKEDARFFVGSGIGLFFLYLIFSPWAAQRAWMYKNIGYLNQRNYWALTNNDVLSLTGIVFLIFNPWSMFTMTLILSFSITFLINVILNMKVNNVWKSVFIAVGAFVVAIPFLSSFNDSFNVIAPIHTFILTPLISFTYGVMMIFLPFHFLWWMIIPLIWILLGALWLFNFMVVTVHIQVKIFLVALFMMSFTFYMIQVLEDYPWAIISILLMEVFAISIL